MEIGKGGLHPGYREKAGVKVVDSVGVGHADRGCTTWPESGSSGHADHSGLAVLDLANSGLRVRRKVHMGTDTGDTVEGIAGRDSGSLGVEMSNSRCSSFCRSAQCMGMR
jgi:hypothetical protein